MAGTVDAMGGAFSDSTKKAEETANAKIGRRTAKEKSVSGTSFDKEMFLKLLSAEMQYQDPLQPTDNTQYVSEMATFSQVEATTNVSNSVDQISANSLVGNYATVKTDDGDVTGMVDYVTKKDDGLYLSIHDKEYKLTDVKKVQDSTYYEAGAAATSLRSMLSDLPDPDDLTLALSDRVKAAGSLFDSMSAYTKQFVSQADADKLSGLRERLSILEEGRTGDEDA